MKDDHPIMVGCARTSLATPACENVRNHVIINGTGLLPVYMLNYNDARNIQIITYYSYKVT